MKPKTYKVICISTYLDDLRKLDRMVEELKSRGHSRVSRSALIRYALSTVNLEGVMDGAFDKGAP
jgi:hypothetical protein